jgi:hypothetical protein
METVCVAWMGYNQVKIYLGVFSDVDTAKQAFIAAGCNLIPANSLETNGISYPRSDMIVVTDEFQTWLDNNVIDCKGLYSVSGDMVIDGWDVCFDTVAFNKIVRGYDDD